LDVRRSVAERLGSVGAVEELAHAAARALARGHPCEGLPEALEALHNLCWQSPSNTFRFIQVRNRIIGIK
jgi:hypothetical protein